MVLLIYVYIDLKFSFFIKSLGIYDCSSSECLDFRFFIRNLTSWNMNDGLGGKKLHLSCLLVYLVIYCLHNSSIFFMTRVTVAMKK